MTYCSIDFETRSTVSLPDTGVYPYARHPSTGIWCFAWAFDNEAPEIWHPGLPFPERVQEHIAAGGALRAWNAQFERIMWRDCGVPVYGFPRVDCAQWVCTMAEALAMNLPGRLGQCAAVTGVAAQKDVEGHNLMMRMARPRSFRPDGSPVWWEVPERMQRLYEYCRQDVRTEMALVGVLRRLSPRERDVYLLDQVINDRGVRVDLPLVEAATNLVEQAVERSNAEIDALTDGRVRAVTQSGQLVRWLQEVGVDTTSVAKPRVRELLEDPATTEQVRRVLTVRSEAGKSSVAKLQSMAAFAGTEDRMRGLLQYHGAGTGRWAGRGPQPQNFTRGEVPEAESYIPWVYAGAYDLIDTCYHPILLVSSLLRAMLCAAPGHDLIAADFSAIEARVLNWVAGQEDVVQSFVEYDAGDLTQDPYKRMAVRMGRAAFTQEVSKQDRQAGKAAELGCGYQMGWKRFVTAAWDVYQVRVDEEQARQAVTAYRNSHPQVVDLWREAASAAKEAVERPGVAQVFGGRRNLRFVRSGNWLFLILPSGRALAYAAPSVEMRQVEPDEGEPFTTRSVMVWGTNSLTKQWEKRALYGGLITENIVQAIARDLMVESMFRLEEAGYPVVLTVHDEIVVEPPAGFGSAEDVVRQLRTLPDWAAGCPVNAEGWRGTRYRK